VRDPAAWLVRATTRLCVDRLRAARAAREAYKGPWLPEPLIEDPADPVERAEDISVAFLLALERLSPLERAVLILHDVMDADYPAIARTLERSETACRQLLSRARAHVREHRPRFEVTPDQVARLSAAFLDAMQRNDIGSLAEVLAEDALLVSDGGGKRKAALRPLVGRADILHFIEGLKWRGEWSAPTRLRIARVNGQLGAVMADAEGPMACAIEVDAQGRLAAIYVMRNPDKLARAVAWLDREPTSQTRPTSLALDPGNTRSSEAG
jgi:RNA polymerase sigma-70 factor (ECF subfamily)